MARITSILDNDLYKFLMQNAVIKLYPEANVRYAFFNRGGTVFPEGFAEKLREAVEEMRNLDNLSILEIEWLKRKCSFLPNPYIDFLAGYRFNPNEVKISQNGGELSVIVEGSWYRTILWEVALMALISQLYFEEEAFVGIPSRNYLMLARSKAEFLESINAYYAEFGTRRRYSYEVQRNVVIEQKRSTTFIGTSNVLLAMNL